LEKIDDPSVLAKLAKSAKCVDIRLQAVKKINDQYVLADIARNDKDYKDYDVRISATRRMNDQILLAEIARNNEEGLIRLAAVQALKDHIALAQVAKNDESMVIRMEAVKKIKDQTVLADIARADNHKDVRKAAVEKLKDQELLVQIARDDEDEDVRDAAKERARLEGKEPMMEMIEEPMMEMIEGYLKSQWYGTEKHASVIGSGFKPSEHEIRVLKQQGQIDISCIVTSFAMEPWSTSAEANDRGIVYWMEYRMAKGLGGISETDMGQSITFPGGRKAQIFRQG
jgi:hypothetical protein